MNKYNIFWINVIKKPQKTPGLFFIISCRSIIRQNVKPIFKIRLFFASSALGAAVRLGRRL